MATNVERRRRTRAPQANQSGFRLRFRDRQGTEQSIDIDLCDISETGARLSIGNELPVNMPVTILGDLTGRGNWREASTPGRVAWCDYVGERRWHSGVEFAVPVDLSGNAKEGDRRKLDSSPFEDYYETLQLSPQAETESVHRMFRYLASRFHPDNPESGSADQFRKVHAAYQVLGTPANRAAYDARYQSERPKQGDIIALQAATGNGPAAEQARRQNILALLYAKRAAGVENAAMSVSEIDQMTGSTKGQLDFSMWYLRELGLVTRADSSKMTITVKGVVEYEASLERKVETRPERRAARTFEAPAAF